MELRNRTLPPISANNNNSYNGTSRQSRSVKHIRHTPLKSHKAAKQNDKSPIIVKTAVNFPSTKKSEIISVKVDTSTPNYFAKFKQDIIEEMEKRYYPAKFDVKVDVRKGGPNTRRIEDGVLQVDIHFKHEVCTTQPTCKAIQKDGQCDIYLSMKNNYEYTQENLDHVQKFSHFNDEYEDKPVCRYNEGCKAYQRLTKGGYRLNDLCHTKLYRHPPRNRKLQLSDQCNEFKMDGDYLHRPTDKEWKMFNKKDGFLDLLIEEVIANGFESDLYIKDNNNNNCHKKKNSSILKIVDEKLKCERHKNMGYPLNRAEMLSIILYTGCEINWSFCADQRNNKYKKWKWFDYCLYHALGRLHERESGNYKIYSGIKQVKLSRNTKNGKFTTFVSCSWKKSEAIEYMKIKQHEDEVVTDGMILEIDRKPPIYWERYDEQIVCADVSWISKHPDECEVLVKRGCAVVLTVKDQKQTDNIGFQVVSACRKPCNFSDFLPIALGKFCMAPTMHLSELLDYYISLNRN